MKTTLMKNDDKFVLSSFQKEIIVGSMLGDANIHWSDDKWQSKFTKVQSLSDKDGIDKISYMKWHWNLLLPASNSVVRSDVNYTYSTYSDNVFTIIERKWYKRDGGGNHTKSKNNKRIKIIPEDIKLTPLVVCIWFMDDGTLDAKNGNATFCTHGFTWEECEFLVERLKQDVGIESHVRKDWRGYPMIFVGVKSHKDLIHLIKPHVEWDCFKYKLDDSYNKQHQSGESHSQSKLTESQVREMIAMRKEGRPVMEIAETFKTSKANVSFVTSGKRWKHLGDGVKLKKKPRTTQEQKARIVALAAKGMCQKTIAAELGIHQSTVSRTLK